MLLSEELPRRRADSRTAGGTLGRRRSSSLHSPIRKRKLFKSQRLLLRCLDLRSDIAANVPKRDAGTNQVPRVFLTPPSPTFRQIRYLAQKMPASTRMARFMRPAVGSWPSDYLAAFHEADRTGRKIRLRWRTVREDLATGRLIIRSEDIKEQFRAAQWEGVDWVDLE